MKTLQIFSCMSVTAKKINELFTPAWNGIAASVKYVSTPVVLNTEIYYWLRRTQTGEDY